MFEKISKGITKGLPQVDKGLSNLTESTLKKTDDFLNSLVKGFEKLLESPFKEPEKKKKAE